MRAHFVDAHTVECNDGVRLSAPHILIATGGHAVKPDIPGAALGGVSDDFFDWTARAGARGDRRRRLHRGRAGRRAAGAGQPGGGVRARRRGCSTGFEMELTDAARRGLSPGRRALPFRPPPRRRARRRTAGVRLRAADDIGSERFDALLFATGRRANTAGLGLETAGVATDAQRPHRRRRAARDQRRRRARGRRCHRQPGADAGRHRRRAAADGPPVRRPRRQHARPERHPDRGVLASADRAPSA